MRKRIAIQVAARAFMYFVLGFFVLLILTILIAFASGLRLFFVASPSMYPAIPQSSVIVVSTRNIDSIEVGDVITFKVQSGVHLTHRVIYANRGADTIITQGDTNNIPDSSITYSVVVGRVVFHSLRFSAVFRFVASPAGIILLVLLPFGAVFINGIVQRRGTQKAATENNTA